MEPGLLLGTIPLAILYFVLSLVKASLRALSRVSLRRLSEEATSTSRRLLLEFLDDPTSFILNLQVLIQVTVIAGAALVSGAMIGRGRPGSLALAFACVAGFVVAFEHLFPRLVMAVDRERLVMRLLPAYGLLAPLARALGAPFAFVLRGLVPPAREDDGGEPSDEEVRAFIDVGEEAGILDATEGEFVESIVDFSETIVREVMTPRVDVVSVEAARTVAEVRDAMIEARHSRIPVYRERVDNVEGVVYIKDLLEAWRDGRESEKVAAWVKPVLFVPEAKSVSSLLKEFKRDRVTFAMVVDEFGGTAGVVTAEDLFAALVGEIREPGEGAPDEVKQDDGSYLLAGKVGVERLDELFGVDLGDGDYETVAGLVFATLGRVPSQGESFAHHGLRIQVVDADRHRVNTVRVSPVGHRAEGGPGAAPSRAPAAEPEAEP